MRSAKVQASLRIRTVSPEPPLLAHTSSESTFRQKARSLAPLNGWACAVKICHDGMLEDTNSLRITTEHQPRMIPLISKKISENMCVVMRETCLWGLRPVKTQICSATPGNVVRGNQTLCKWNPYGSSQPWLTDLQTVNKQVNAPWILLFVNFRSFIFLNRAMWFPVVFISTPGGMNMGVENQAVCL